MTGGFEVYPKGASSASAPPALFVSVVCADRLRRRRIVALLGRSSLPVVASAGSPTELLARMNGNPPDAVVLAWERLTAGEADCVTAVRERLPAAGIVGTSAHATVRAIRDTLAGGADGFVMECELEACLAPTVRAVCSGQLVVPRTLRDQVAGPVLSAREKQVLGMVVMGFTNGEIAGKLHLAESTVKSHLSSIFGKLGARSRNEAAALVLDPEQGLGVGILAIAGPMEEGP